MFDGNKKKNKLNKKLKIIFALRVYIHIYKICYQVHSQCSLPRQNLKTDDHYCLTL